MTQHYRTHVVKLERQEGGEHKFVLKSDPMSKGDPSTPRKPPPGPTHAPSPPSTASKDKVVGRKVRRVMTAPFDQDDAAPPETSTRRKRKATTQRKEKRENDSNCARTTSRPVSVAREAARKRRKT
ncbi:hypothetical protein HKX48_009272 [Thoreauomyces humboldtii]|nr:hypothetical protein HKX48_009272 [Thoreauomyces humboldtii]